MEIQITRGLIFSRTIASTIIETECFFHFSGFFVNIKEKLNISFYSIFPTITEKFMHMHKFFHYSRKNLCICINFSVTVGKIE